MKAAVLHQFGQAPRYEDFPDPVPGQDELLIHVKAVAVENIDKMMAAGTHFASRQFLGQLPAVVGLDGIGMLENGTLVGFGGVKPPYGALAEKTVVPATHTIPVPDGVDAIIAAALPASALTALFPLKWTAQLQPGETVLVNGATGVSGKLAVQIARLLGAGRIIGTGRNDEALRLLRDLGADAVIDLKLSDAHLTEAFTEEIDKGCDIILDFLWGRPTEVLIKTLVPQELAFAPRRVRLIQIGEMAGPTIALSADAIRTSGLEIFGAGAGISPEAIAVATNQVWDWIAQDKLHMQIEQVPLKDVEHAWQRTDLQGKRIVVIP
jgi:NADPH:quinone reductase-like Zn-dependent oxidoreductase